MATNPDESTANGPEGQVVLGLVGDHPKAKILFALLTDPNTDYNISDVARMADADRSTVHRHIDDLLEYGVIKKTRKAGNAWMYQIDKDNGAAEALATLEWEAIKAFSENRDRDGDG